MADRHYGPRKNKHWHSILGTSQSLTANGNFLGAQLALNGPWTAIRMLGEYIIGADAAPTAQDAVTIGVGIGVVSADAFIAGAASVPGPVSEPQYPWLYWANHDFFFVDSGLEDRVITSIRKSFDVKSMRKLKPRESLVTVIEYSDVAGTPAMQFCMPQTRVLVAD